MDVLASAKVQSAQVELAPPNFPPELQAAIIRVARDFNLSRDWLNAQVGLQWETGLPDRVDEDIEWLEFGGLHLGLASRQTLIALKLAAAVDHGRESVHVQDLIALSPSDEEFAEAERWVVEQDALPEHPQFVAEVIRYVRDQCTDL